MFLKAQVGALFLLRELDRNKRFQVHCGRPMFRGVVAVDTLMDTGYFRSRESAVKFGRVLAKWNMIKFFAGPSDDFGNFTDGIGLYRFTENVPVECFSVTATVGGSFGKIGLHTNASVDASYKPVNQHR